MTIDHPPCGHVVILYPSFIHRPALTINQSLAIILFPSFAIHHSLSFTHHQSPSRTHPIHLSPRPPHRALIVVSLAIVHSVIHHPPAISIYLPALTIESRSFTDHSPSISHHPSFTIQSFTIHHFIGGGAGGGNGGGVGSVLEVVLEEVFGGGDGCDVDSDVAAVGGEGSVGPMCWRKRWRKGWLRW